MKLRKKIVGFLLIVSLIGLFACATTLSAPKQVTLSVLCEYVTEAQRSTFQKLLDDYQKLHPNIKLNVQVTTQAKWPEIMAARAVAKDLPDVSTCVVQRIGQWAATGALEAGDRYIPASVLNKFPKGYIVPDTYKGKIYGLPITASLRLVAYNKDYFDKAGITPPQTAKDAWTWDQMVEAAKKAQKASGAKYALQFERNSFDGWLSFIYQAGGQLMTDDQKKSALNSPQVRRALEWTVKLHKDGVAAPGIIEGTEDASRLFASGMTTMWMPSYNSLIRTVSLQSKYKIGVTLMPKDAKQATVSGGTHWVAFKGKNPKEAWDLLLYLVNPQSMELTCEEYFALPPRSDVKVNWLNEFGYASVFAEQATQVPANLVLHQVHPAYAACRDYLLLELSACVSGQKSVEDAMLAMDKIMNQALQDYNKKQ